MPDEREEQWTPIGDIETSRLGALTICAILRGEQAHGLRHHLSRLTGSAWAIIAEVLSKANGNAGDLLSTAIKGIRIAGQSESESRVTILAELTKWDAFVDDWLQTDPSTAERYKLPRQRAIEAKGMYANLHWLWPAWIPRGYLSMIAGRPGAGKSFITAWLASNAVAELGKFPNGYDTDCTGKEIMWIDTEATQKLLTDRLTLMSAPDHLFFWPLDPLKPTDRHPLVDLTDERWLKIVTDNVLVHKPCWVIVDSLRGAHGADENSSEMQAMMHACAALARDLNIPFTFIHHLRKASEWERDGQVHLDMLRGSSAIAAMARVVIAIDIPDPERASEKRIRVIKSNLDLIPDPIGVEIGPYGPKVMDAAPAAPRRPSVVDTAAEFLLVTLARGPVKASDVFDEAQANGISKASLQRARERLRIVAVRLENHWQWSLPSHLPDDYNQQNPRPEVPF